MKNKILHGLIPAVLIHLSIGFVYSWSVISLNLESIFKDNLNFAFSLSIFFLGFSAAFMGDFVEKYKPKISAFISAIFFISGIILTSIGINLVSTTLVFLGYGILMGIGLGIGYITPIKTLMLWYPNNSGFATGCAVTGFGLASSIASPTLKWLIPIYGISKTLLLMSSIYFIMLLIAILLIKKPENNNLLHNEFNYKNIISNKNFLYIWLIMFLNILCGITLISNTLNFLNTNISETLIYITLILMGIFNGSGRLGIAWLSDIFKNKANIFIVIFIISVILTILSILNPSYYWISLIILSATYGAGFSCLPLLIKYKFGIENLSKIHGLALTAWGTAGLVSSSFFTLAKSLEINFFVVISILYFMALLLTFKLLKK